MSYYLIGDSGSVYFEPFDGVIEGDSVTYSNKATGNPIEGGSNINDHAVSDPVKVDISGTVTNMPRARATLIAMSVNRDLLTYRGDAAYNNMLIISLTLSKSREAGTGGFVFKALLQQMDITGAAYAPVVVTMRSSDAAATTAKKGAKSETVVGLTTPTTDYAAHVSSFDDPTPSNKDITNARTSPSNKGY